MKGNGEVNRRRAAFQQFIDEWQGRSIGLLTVIGPAPPPASKDYRFGFKDNKTVNRSFHIHVRCKCGKISVIRYLDLVNQRKLMCGFCKTKGRSPHEVMMAKQLRISLSKRIASTIAEDSEEDLNALTRNTNSGNDFAPL